MPQLRPGDPVSVPTTHVIDIDWADRHSRPKVIEKREYWERCYVDDCVLRGASHVDYLYREEPDETPEGDIYPDSGWRIRGTTAAIEADDRAGLSFSYIAIGKALNSDGRWLYLLDEPAA